MSGRSRSTGIVITGRPLCSTSSAFAGAGLPRTHPFRCNEYPETVSPTPGTSTNAPCRPSFPLRWAATLVIWIDAAMP